MEAPTEVKLLAGLSFRGVEVRGWNVTHCCESCLWFLRKWGGKDMN